ncbi:MAG: FAD-binding oxidoreductase [Bacteroidia bacterium]|nr:FAD-binding oxidoreductase [Bacteroidia bacterium]MCC7532411.1 FAD-binding oxidoreductase [Bacteroidia bacterium]
MKTIIIGNGIIGLTTALRLALKAKTGDKIVIVGKKTRPYSATNAAAAMLNSFCEIEADTFKNEIDSIRFGMSYQATKMWPGFVLEHLEVAMGHNCLLAECRTCMGPKGACYELGTYLINNCSADSLDDANYNAVLKALKDFYEPYEEIDPVDIPNYMPQARHRASKAVYIHNEGWLNPKLTLLSIEASLLGFSCVSFVDEEVETINESGRSIASVTLKNKSIIEGDKFLLATGASASKIIDNSNLSISIPKIFNGVGVSIQIKSPEYPHSKAIRTPNRGLACGLYTVPFYSSPDVPLNELIIGSSSFVTPFTIEGARVGSVQSLLQGAMEQINTNFYKAEISCINLGYRPVSADTYPVFGKTSINNLFICTGTKRDGFHLSPLLSDLMCKLILGDEIDPQYNVFAPERSLIKTYTREEAIEASVKHLMSASYQHGFVPSHDKLHEKIKQMHRDELETLHDKVGAFEWGISPELLELYRYGHISS